MTAGSEVRAARIMNHRHTRLYVAQTTDRMTARHANIAAVKSVSWLRTSLRNCDLPFRCVSKTLYFSRRDAFSHSSNDTSCILFDTIALQISKD